LQALRGPAADAGLWNGPKVADYLSELIGQPISRQQGWEYLKQMRLRLRVPRQSHQEADTEEQEAWKKTDSGTEADSSRVSRRRRRGLV
jgi:transposase